MRNELKDKRWIHLREYILRRDRYIDQVAARYGKRLEASTVHHIFPREHFPEYTFTEWNLISVSKTTHNQLHGRESHKLTAKGFELLLRTARKQKIEITDGLREILCD